MDQLKRKILILLQGGDMCKPRISEIAKKIGKSTVTVYRKIKEMEFDGTIKGYIGQVDPIKLGRGLTSIVRIQIEYPKGRKITHEEFIKKYTNYFSKLKEVQEVHIPAGTWDIILKVKTPDTESQYKFISEKVMPVGNIRRVESIILMKTIKEGNYVHPGDGE